VIHRRAHLPLQST